MKNEILPLKLRISDVGKLQVKAHLIANLFFGPPVIFFILLYADLPLNISLIVQSISFFISIGIFTPLAYTLPFLVMKKTKILADQWNLKRTPDATFKLVENLFNIPTRLATVEISLLIPGLVLGLILQLSGLVPGFDSIALYVIFAATCVSVAIMVIQVVMIYILTEQYLRSVIEFVTTQDESVLVQRDTLFRVPIIKKIFFIIFVSVLSSQLTLIGLFLMRLSTQTIPTLTSTLVFSIICVLMASGYVFFATYYFTRYISQPLNRIKKWSNDITEGKFDSVINVITNDEFSGVFGAVTHMVSTLKREQQRVGEERNKLSVILKSIVDGVVAVDVNSKVVMINDSAKKITGWSNGDATDKTISEVVKVYDSTNNQLFTKFNYPIESLIKYSEGIREWNELRLVKKNGEERFVSITVNKLLVGEDKEEGVVFIIHDITKEKQLQEMKLDFVSMATHELRSPITAVLGYMSVFFQENEEKLDDDQKILLHRVQSSAHQLSGLVENLLSVSKIERGALSLSYKTRDWLELVREVVSDMQFQAKDKRIKLQLELPQTNTIKVHVDEIRIKEVLTNLIANAINYTLPNGSVTVMVAPEGDYVVTQVKDTGVGIPADAIPKLFSKFYRVNNKLSAESRGTGLGLYISRSIVEMHKGKISVSSELDVGSTFSFTLPILKSETEEIS